MVEKKTSKEVERCIESVDNRRRLKLYKQALYKLGLKKDSANMKIFSDCLKEKMHLEQFINCSVWKCAKRAKIEDFAKVKGTIQDVLSFDERARFVYEHEIIINVLYAMKLFAIALAFVLQPPFYIVVPSFALAYAFDIKGYSERPSMLTAKIAMIVYSAILISMIATAIIK